MSSRTACVAALCALGIGIALALPAPAAARGDGAGAPAAPSAALGDLRRDGASVATELTKLTGVSLSPLVGMSVVGAWSWYRAPPERRARLPWHQQPWFWGSGLALLALLFVADKVPVLRTLGKHVRLWENKLVGAVAVAVMVDDLARASAGALERALAAAAGLGVPSALAAEASAPAASPAPWLALAVAATLSTVVSVAVWLAGHAVEVLVLMSPLALLDALLRTARLAALALLATAGLASPALGVALAIPIALASLLAAGWAFRLSVFGAVFSWDFVTVRRDAPAPDDPVRAFATAIPGVPKRTFGRLVRDGGGLRFRWRPWLVGPARARALPRVAELGVGLVSPVVFGAGGGIELARLPPRYRGASAAVAAALGGVPVADVPLVRTLRAAWELLTGTEAAGTPR